MEFKLLDNGIDSLKMGLEFYENYLDSFIQNEQNLNFNKDSYLKLAVICIHNSVEILSKMILSEFNDLLIYKNLDDVLSDLADIKINDNKKSLHNFLIENDKHIETVTYQLCIERLEKLYSTSLTKNNIQDFKDIGYERNKITHFGILKQLDYHKLIGLINRIIQCMGKFFLVELNLIDDSNYNELVQKVYNIPLKGALIESNEWVKFTTNDINNLIELINKYVESIKGINLNMYSNEKDKIFYIDKENTTSIIDTRIVPYLDSVFLGSESDEGDKLIAIIDFADNKYIYECKNTEFAWDIEFEDKMWKKNTKDFIRVNLDITQLKRVLEKYIN